MAAVRLRKHVGLKHTVSTKQLRACRVRSLLEHAAQTQQCAWKQVDGRPCGGRSKEWRVSEAKTSGEFKQASSRLHDAEFSEENDKVTSDSAACVCSHNTSRNEIRSGSYRPRCTERSLWPSYSSPHAVPSRVVERYIHNRLCVRRFAGVRFHHTHTLSLLSHPHQS